MSSLDVIESEFRRAEQILEKVADATRPYEFKYEARNVFKKLLEHLCKINDLDDGFKSVFKAHILVQMGIIDREVEELSEAQIRFEEAIRISVEFIDPKLNVVAEEEKNRVLLDDNDSIAKNEEKEGFEDGQNAQNAHKLNESSECVDKAAWVIVPYVDALNQLGFLWCERGDFEKAKQSLDEALAAYSNFTERNEEKNERIREALPDLLAIIDFLKKSQDRNVCSEGKNENKLEQLNTYTHFYLAQVLKSLGKVHEAAESCHTTLQKQLRLECFERKEWALNAATLAHYFFDHGQFEEARAHLAAAMAIASERKGKDKAIIEAAEEPEDDEDEEEAVKLCIARIERGCGNLCLALLQSSVEKLNEENTHTSKGNFGGDLVSYFGDLALKEEVMSIPIESVENFEQAREIFLKGQRFFRRSQEMFTLDEHCVDHAEIAQSLSRLHKLLAQFEPDLTRCYKIHRRRLDLLEPILNALSPSYYLLLMRQLQLELAEVHESMLEAKLEIMNTINDPTKKLKEGPKVNLAVDSALEFYQAYLNSFKSIENGTLEFPKDDWRSCMLAYFHMARLHSKHISQTVQRHISSLQSFKAILNFCERNEECKEIMRKELPICQEMAQLLTMNIERRKSQGAV